MSARRSLMDNRGRGTGIALPWACALVVLGSLGGATSWAPALAAQESGIETAGDVIMVAIPITALSLTFVADDGGGRAPFVGAFLSNVGATFLLKGAISRERPDGSDDNSLPSGHTSIAFQGASFVHFRYGLGRAAPIYAAATFVGYSRVSADKHYVSDVLLGAVLGTALSAVFTDRFEELEVAAAPAGDGSGIRIDGRLWVP